jgi:aminoglycoside phosphotransferase (APT) family kinase protein
MAREYRVVSALNATSVPVACPVTLCDDASVIGAPFAMVEYVVGQVIRSRTDLDTVGGCDVLTRYVDGLIPVLADLHSVDPGAVGLNDFGRPDGYLQRQVHRWASQWDYVGAPDDHCDGDVQRLHGLLVRSIPPQSGTSIVHGDYRIDNIIVDSNDPARVRAVVDWELSTLGDPLSDVASMCVYRDPVLDLIIG